MLRAALAWMKRRAAPAGSPSGDGQVIARFLAGARDDETLDAARRLLQGTRLRDYAGDARIADLQRFLIAASAEGRLVRAPGVAIRLCELARRAGVQAECAAGLAGFVSDLTRDEPASLPIVLGFLDGAVDAAVFARAQAAAGPAADDPADALPAAFTGGAVRPALAAIEAAGGIDRLIEAVRPYSATLRPLALRVDEWDHGAADPAAMLRLALALSDTAALAQMETGDAALAAFAARACGDLDAFDGWYAGLAAADGVRALRFRGETLAELFGELVGDPGDVGAGPLVSVILTACDPDPVLLGHAVASIRGQSHGHFELLLVDDGSADGGAALAQVAAGDPRARLLATPRNLGPYGARNLALGEARGAFIAIQDADDVSHPDRFARQIAEFTANPALFACVSRALRFDSAGWLQLGQATQAMSDGTMTTMYRSILFDRLGPFAEVRSRGDVEYRERIARTLGAGAMATIACPLVFCGAAPTSLSNRVDRRALDALRRNFMLRQWRPAGEGFAAVGPLVVPRALQS